LDAAEGKPFAFSADAYNASASQLKLLREILTGTSPRESGILKQLDGLQSPCFLALRDSGTTGMGGGIFAGRSTFDSENRNDWVDFIFKIGQPPDRNDGAGTYGYGKAAYYRASQVNTICIYTRCHHKGKPETRLIFSRLGDQFSIKKGRKVQDFTGRQWWGKKADKEMVYPFVGAEADRIAKGLGIKTYAKDEFGTTAIIIAACDFKNPHEAIVEFCRYSMWSFWPAMVAGKNAGYGPLSLSVTLNGETPQGISTSPAEDPRLRHFIEALKFAKGATVSEPASTKLNVSKAIIRKEGIVGRLGMNIIPIGNQTTPPQKKGGWIPSGPLQHIACMRNSGMVICYHDGQVVHPQGHKFNWCGVFVTDESMERAFADSEPPSHDEWQPENVGNKTYQTTVRMLKRSLSTEPKTWLKGGAALSGESSSLSLGPISNELGTALGLGGRDGCTRARGPSGGRGGTGRKSGGIVAKIDQQVIRYKNGRVCQEIHFSFKTLSAGILKPSAFVVLADGSRESEPPEKSLPPELLEFVVDGAKVDGPSAEIPASKNCQAVVCFGMPDGCRVAVDINFEEDTS